MDRLLYYLLNEVTALTYWDHLDIGKSLGGLNKGTRGNSNSTDYG